MVSRFRYEVESFLSENMVKYHVLDDRIVIADYKIVLHLKELSRRSSGLGSVVEPDCRRFTIYEDLWFTKGSIIRNRLLANMGLGERVFARKCVVREIGAERVKSFMEENHLIGDAKSRFRYGLFDGEELVSAATFSSSRPMEREGRVVQSYEWVRYANRSSVRVVGGMGRLLNYFVNEVSPDEVMSYADKDWSDGDVYRKLGFVQIGETSPVEFYVNSETCERISVKKLRNDRKYRDSAEFTQNEIRKALLSENFPDSSSYYVLFSNSGNLKFLRSFSF